MATIDQSELEGKIRNRPIAPELEVVLRNAADLAGIETVKVTSGGQPGTHGRRIGSTRHENGRAAEFYLVRNGKTLRFTDKKGNSHIEAFVTAAAAGGANGIGAGERYMGNKTIHVGFGTSPSDHRQIVWGAGGRAANAPAWLREAAREGWDNPVPVAEYEAYDSDDIGGFVVNARGGLHLRKGPGLAYGISKTIGVGTFVSVVGFDGPDGDWARVDLEGDGMFDGHLYAAFLTPVSAGEAVEEVEEPA